MMFLRRCADRFPAVTQIWVLSRKLIRSRSDSDSLTSAKKYFLKNDYKSQFHHNNKTFKKSSTINSTDYIPANVISTTNSREFILPAQQPFSVRFACKQSALPEQGKLGEIFAQKVAAKEFFYGIEMTARPKGKEEVALDFESFGAVRPIFTSLVWVIADYADVSNVKDVIAIRMAHELSPHIIVLVHFTCYCADKKRVQQFLDEHFTNVLVVRGDKVDKDQLFPNTKDLVAYIREVKGDAVSIGAGAYPECHPDAHSIQEDMTLLKQKVEAGADFLITQICYSTDKIIAFLNSCRDNCINVPIIIGIIVPENMKILNGIMKISKVRMEEDVYKKFQDLEKNNDGFQNYAVSRAVETVRTILDSDLNVYGFQFYTLNRLKNVKRVLKELEQKKSSTCE